MRTPTHALLIASLAMFFLTLGQTADAVTIAESTFDTDLDGWTFVDATDAEFNFVDTGGNPGGYAEFIDSPALANSPFMVAPAKFLGDWTAYDNLGLFSYDQNIIVSGDVAAFEALTVRLDGADGSIAVFRSFVDVAAIGLWIHVDAPIVESAWTVTGSWASLLADVAQVRIVVERVENSSSLIETVGTDNVRLDSVPEPGTGMLVGLGLVGLALRRGKRAGR